MRTELYIKNRFSGEIIFESNKTDMKEVIHDATLSNADLIDADLQGADLSNANLHNADLSNANLHNADLYDADLSNANLHNADLYDADLSNANLHDAKFLGNTGNLKKLTKKQLPHFLKALGFVVK